jgi:EpsI family protein
MILRGKYAWLLTIVLVVQGGAYYGIRSRSELTPPAAPLSSFPAQLGGWQMAKEFPIEKEVQDVLRADDTLSRDYVNLATAANASLLIAFFKTQRYGQSPHSPKNCLPGAGWEPTETGTMAIAVPEWEQPILVNRYVVVHGEDKVLTIYWYQGRHRVIASEYWAKFWLVMDAIRYRRSDTSLVRVMVPVRDNDTDAATKTGVAFVQSLFPALLKQLPN